ncbi:MAG: hypothetical protein U1A81_02875 [Hydrogenophaga sp.]|nr:hypothetical protein [Hydrogenophaga sp.]
MSSSAQPLESAWQTLRSSLEWGQSFGLVFVFSGDARAKQALFQRADDVMLSQVRPFQRPAVPQANALLTDLLPLAVNPANAHTQTRMPLWLDLDGHPGNPSWDEARLNFLHRLNERRATLVREHPRTVVLALPLDWTKQAAEAAPDLWTIRQPSVYLAPADTPPTESPPRTAADNPAAPTPPSRDLPASVVRWLAAQEEHPASRSVWSAARAVEAALETGHTELAWQIAERTVADTRTTINALGRTPERLRDLSISLEKRGNVAQALGRLDEAQPAYTEGESLRRALIDEFGRTPERLRDLSISLEKRGNVAQALGRLDEAQRWFAAEVATAEDLIDHYGETANAMEVLAYGELGWGQALNQANQSAQALPHLDRARRLYQRLALALPHDQRYSAALAALGEPDTQD